MNRLNILLLLLFISLTNTFAQIVFVTEPAPPFFSWKGFRDVGCGAHTFCVDPLPPSRFISHNGITSVKVDKMGSGFIVAGDNSSVDPIWGGHWYGLSMSDKNKMYFNKIRSSSYRFPVALNGYYGIGFRTSDGKMSFLENGILTIGLDNAKTVALSDNPATNPIKMYVASGIRSEQIVTDSPSLWSDYVFKAEYKLRSLSDLRLFINEHHHLPDIPSAEEVLSTGVNLSEMDALLLKKIEELTLYLFALEDEYTSLMTTTKFDNND